MKRTLALFMVLVLALAMSPAALAANGEDNIGLGTSEGNVIVDILDSITDSTDSEVYYVTVTWQNLTNFQFDFEGEGLHRYWNPESHAYEIQTSEHTPATGSWTGATSKDITVSNHSNSPVHILAAFDTGASKTTDGVTSTLTNREFDLATAVGTVYASAPNDQFTVAVTGVPTVTTGYTVGKITVTVSDLP